MADLTPRLPTLGDVDRRLLHTGVPILVSNATVVVIPVIARGYLSTVDYAVFALLMTVVVAAGILDLGGGAYVQSFGYGRATTTREYATAVGLATGGAAAVTSAALAASTVVVPRLGSDLSTGSVVALVAASGLAAMARGAVAVMMSRLQIAQRFALRSTVAGVQAVLQVGACWLLLASGLGLWALPWALALGSGVALVGAHLVLVTRPTDLPTAARRAPVARFASFRTMSALLGIGSSQADRWVLALVAAPLFLADYDTALRFAALPAAFVGAVFVGIVAESAAAPDDDDRHSLVRRYTARVAGVVTALSLAVAVGVVLLGTLGLVPLSRQLLLILGMALVWSGTNAVTAPTTFAFVGVGAPQKELLYAAPAFACTALGWVLAIWVDQQWLVPGALLVAVSTWSAWFVHYGTRRASYRPGPEHLTAA